MGLQNLALNEAKKAAKRRECEKKPGSHSYERTNPSVLGGKPYPAVICKRCKVVKVFNTLDQLKAALSKTSWHSSDIPKA